MSSIEPDSELEEVHLRHRKEKKDLQAKIQCLKKSATKGDKKKKREVTEEIIKLEVELNKKHAEELLVFNGSNGNVTSLTEDFSNLNSCEEMVNDEPKEDESKDFKVTKAQRRREKKANALKERELRITEQDEQNIYGTRNQEILTVKALLKKKGLMINEIPSDGNCLYCAVADQLKQSDSIESLSMLELRDKTGVVLRENQTQFLPFLSHPDTGEMLTESQYLEYCDQVAQTNAWGGQVELLALSKALNCRIEVVQATGTPVTVGESGPLLTLTYHRHMYGLGEHYNSTKPYEEEPSDDL